MEITANEIQELVDKLPAFGDIYDSIIVLKNTDTTYPYSALLFSTSSGNGVSNEAKKRLYATSISQIYLEAGSSENHNSMTYHYNVTTSTWERARTGSDDRGSSYMSVRTKEGAMLVASEFDIYTSSSYVDKYDLLPVKLNKKPYVFDISNYRVDEWKELYNPYTDQIVMYQSKSSSSESTRRYYVNIIKGGTVDLVTYTSNYNLAFKALNAKNLNVTQITFYNQTDALSITQNLTTLSISNSSYIATSDFFGYTTLDIRRGNATGPAFIAAAPRLDKGLPKAIEEFKTPHSDLIVVKTETEGLYQVYQLCANSTQKFSIAKNGSINSNANIFAESALNYDDKTDTWTKTNKRTLASYNFTVGEVAQQKADTSYIVYSTVDFYDSKYTTLLREKDERVNCNDKHYYTLDQNLLIDEVQAVYDESSDAFVVLRNSSNNDYANVYILKNVADNYIKPEISISNYIFNFNTATERHEFVINRSDYSLVSSNVTASATYLPSFTATIGLSLREVLEYTTIDLKLSSDSTTTVIPKQEVAKTPHELLPGKLREFKTPYSDLVIMKTNTEGTYFVRTFSTTAEDQKMHLYANGQLRTCDGKVPLYESYFTYEVAKDDWGYVSSSSKRTYGESTTVSTDTSLTDPADIDQILYSTVDLYDASGILLYRKKDEKVNCFIDDYFVLNEKILEINEVKQVYNPETDGLFIGNDGSTYFNVYVIKNALEKSIDVKFSTYWYFYPSEATTVHKITITASSMTYKTSTTKEYSTADYFHYYNTSAGWLREQILYTNLPLRSINPATLDAVLIQAQKMPSLEAEILPESITATPATVEGLIGTTHQLAVEVLPTEAEDKTVTFSSSKTSVATVDENGLITLTGEGTATITITSNRVTDLSTQVMVTAIRPYEKPVINSLTISPDKPYEGQDVEFSYDVTYDRATFKAEEWENKQDSYEAGQQTVRVRVQDSNDLWSDWKELTFTVEAVYQQPTISNLVMTPANPQIGEEVSFNYDKNLDTRLELKSENWTNKKSSYEAGTHTVKLTITDSADQVSNELSVTFSIEQPYVPTAPVLKSIKMTPESPKAGETVTFSYEADLDETATVQEEIWENKKTSYEAGDHEVALTLVDSFGQQSNRKTISFSVERVKDKPVISNLRMTPENPTIEDDIVFTYDAVIDPELTLKSENWVNKKSSYEEGTHTVNLTITDSADQVSNELSITFEVAYVPEVPVLDSITITPDSPLEGEAVEFNYVAYIDERATIKEEIWEGKQETYEAGDHEVALTIVDSFSQRSNRMTLQFTVEALPEPPIEETPDENLPPMPSSFPYVYDIVIDPPNPRAGELLSYSYTVALEAGTCLETMTWTNKRMIYDEAGEIEMALKIVDSKGREAQKAITVEILEPSETPHPQKPLRIKHLEVTRWDSASKRFIILEGREK